jgi:hypothetical protein
MFESMKMATFNGVPIAIYGLSGITLVLLTLLTFKADALAPNKKKDSEEKKTDVEENKPEEQKPDTTINEIPEAKVEEVPPMAEVVGMEKNTFGGKRNKNKTKSKRNKRKRANKTKSKHTKK